MHAIVNYTFLLKLSVAIPVNNTSTANRTVNAGPARIEYLEFVKLGMAAFKQ